jgi:hypothetical protein
MIHDSGDETGSLVTSAAIVHLCSEHGAKVTGGQRNNRSRLECDKARGYVTLRAISARCHMVIWLRRWRHTLKCLSVTSTAAADYALVTKGSLQPVSGLVAAIARTAGYQMGTRFSCRHRAVVAIITGT